MKMLFFGDSVTFLEDGYVKVLTDAFEKANPGEHEIINSGICGNRVVDLLARVKKGCINYKPDLINILVGVNDVWHEFDYTNGVRIELYEKIYRILLDEIKLALPNVKLIMCEPFYLKGKSTTATKDRPNLYEDFKVLYDYQKVVKKIASDYGIPFVELQDEFLKCAKVNGEDYYLGDGVHPTVEGAKLIANEWMKVFEKHYK